MNDLRAMTSSALLGTERSPLGRLENAALEAARVSLEGRGSAAQLLGVAMLALNMTRAGGEASKNLLDVSTAKADARAEIPEIVKNRLDDLLNSRKDLIPEWLGLINQKDWRLPHSHLAMMLTQAQHNTTNSLREGVRATMDARGQWLAAQNPAWHWAVGEVSSLETAFETWETGTKTARVMALRSLRTEKPAEARGLLEVVWKSEVAEERKAFLAELETGISSADEAFLETCLNDRSKEVRSLAATLLTKLPSSAFVERMISRGELLIKLGQKKFKLGTPDLDITLPEWTADLGRDGIEKKTPYSSGGDKAYWLERIISSIPIEFWEIHLRLEPPEILKRLPKDWKNTIQTGFVQAIGTNPNPKWIEALLGHDSKLMENATLMNTLPLEQREKRVRYFVFAKQNKQTHWLEWMNHPWSLEFTRDCLEWLGILGKQILGGTNEYFSAYQIALLCNPNVVQHWHDKQKHPHWTAFLEQTENYTAPEKNNNAWYVKHHLEQIRDLTNIIETRAAMRKELL